MSLGFSIALGFLTLVVNDPGRLVATTEMAKLAGFWRAESTATKERTVFYPAGSCLAIIILPEAGLRQNSNFQVDPTKKPKEFRLEVTDGWILGIYELDGDRLKICHFEDPKISSVKRSSKLATHQGSGAVVESYERLSAWSSPK
jgi:uncharacterized protein (TIGR03067 family)